MAREASPELPASVVRISARMTKGHSHGKSAYETPRVPPTTLRPATRSYQGLAPSQDVNQGKPLTSGRGQGLPQSLFIYGRRK
jgi:hypothetical protein